MIDEDDVGAFGHAGPQDQGGHCEREVIKNTPDPGAAVFRVERNSHDRYACQALALLKPYAVAGIDGAGRIVREAGEHLDRVAEVLQGLGQLLK